MGNGQHYTNKIATNQNCAISFAVHRHDVNAFVTARTCINVLHSFAVFSYAFCMCRSGRFVTQ